MSLTLEVKLCCGQGGRTFSNQKKFVLFWVKKTPVSIAERRREEEFLSGYFCQVHELFFSGKALFFSMENLGCGMGECGKGGEGVGES